jgi:hypothetical protein
VVGIRWCTCLFLVGGKEKRDVWDGGFPGFALRIELRCAICAGTRKDGKSSG